MSTNQIHRLLLQEMINYQRMLISTCVWASKDAENVLAAIVQEVIKFMNRLLLIILVDINNRSNIDRAHPYLLQV